MATNLKISGKEITGLWQKWWPVVLLGWVTIGSYGLVFYAFGVLIDPIKTETGWTHGALSWVFSISMLVSGFGALLAGRLVDGVGSRPVMIGSLVIGSTLLMASSFAQSYIFFCLTWGFGGGVIGAGLFYNVTMAVTTRLYGLERTVAFSVLTFIGGLASPLFFPVAGFLVGNWGWRSAVQVQVVLMLLLALPAIIFVKNTSGKDSPADNPDEPGAGFSGIKEAIFSPQVIYMTLAFAATLGTLSAIQVHHVPAMMATGLTLAAATGIAALRGFLSLPGRALLTPVVNRTGVSKAIIIIYGATAIGLASLLLAGPFAFIVLFAVITGLTYGMIMPLHGLYQAEVFGQAKIGTLMGISSTVVGVVGALGPALLGMIISATGGYKTFLIICVALSVASMFFLAASKKAGK